MKRRALPVLCIIVSLFFVCNNLYSQVEPMAISSNSEEERYAYDISFVRSLPYNLNIFYTYIPLYQVNHLPSYSTLPLLQGKAYNAGTSIVSDFHLETTINGIKYSSDSEHGLLYPGSTSSAMLVKKSMNGLLNFGPNTIRMEVVLENDNDQNPSNNFEERIMYGTNGMYAMDALDFFPESYSGYGLDEPGIFGNVYAVANSTNQYLKAFYISFGDNAVVGTKFKLIVYNYLFTYNYVASEPLASYDLEITEDMINQFVRIDIPEFTDFFVHSYGMLYCAIRQMTDEPVNIAVDNDPNGIIYQSVINSYGNMVLMRTYDHGNCALRIDLGTPTNTVKDPPTNLKVDRVRTHYADLSWEGEGAHQVQIGNNEPIVVVGRNHYQVTGLDANTTYTWKVRAITSENRVGPWVSGGNFKTLIFDGPIMDINSEQMIVGVSSAHPNYSIPVRITNLCIDSLHINVSGEGMPGWLTLNGINADQDYYLTQNRSLFFNVAFDASGLPNGNYSYVLSVNNNSYYVDNVYEIPVMMKVRNEHVVTMEPVEGASLNGLPYVIDGFNYSFSIELDEPYSESDIVVMVNSEVIEPVSGHNYLCENVTEDLVITVSNVELNNYYITTSVNPPLSGVVRGNVSPYEHGTQVTLRAVASNSTFDNWTENGEIVSTSTTYRFNITSNRTLVANFTFDTYQLTAVSNNETMGTVTGSGIYSHNDTATFIGTAKSGYEFFTWTDENDNVVSTESTYTFVVTGPVSLTGNFRIPHYNIVVEASPEAAGTVTGGGEYILGDIVTLTATPNPNCGFISWTENGTVVSTNAVYTFTATSHRHLVANFYAITYHIELIMQPAAGGLAVGGGDLISGSTAIVHAYPNTNYQFARWTEADTVVSLNPIYSFTVDRSRTLTAVFNLTSYMVVVTCHPAEGGYVTGTGDFPYYTYGQPAYLTAHANYGYTFDHWTVNGNNYTANPFFTYIYSSMAVDVYYTINQYQIGVVAAPSTSGHVFGSGVYDYNTQISVYAVPYTNYLFLNWTENDSIVSTDATYSFNVTRNRNLVGNFVQQFCNVNVTNPNPAGGTVSGAGTYTYGDSVNLVTSLNEGYSFNGWYEGNTLLESDTVYSFIARKNYNLTVSITLNYYDVVATIHPASSGTVIGTGNYGHGTEITLTAIPAEGYSFKYWVDEGIVFSRNSSITFTVNRDWYMEVYFELETTTFTVTVSASPANGGNVSGAGTYSLGATAMLTANPNTASHYYFRGWYENDELLSESEEYNVVINRDRNFVGLFKLYGDANDDGMISVLDVVNLVNYIMGNPPAGFDFRNADVNCDGIINALDLVGIINYIFNKGTAMCDEIIGDAVYTVENGVLYIESPVEISAFSLKFDSEVAVMESLDNFDVATRRISDDEYIVVVYSMKGYTLKPGKYALMTVGNAKITDYSVSSPDACEIGLIDGGILGIDGEYTFSPAYPNPFNTSVMIERDVTGSGSTTAEFVVTSITGQVVYRIATNGNFVWTPVNVNSGVYFINVYVDGVMVRSDKVIYKH